MGLSHTVSEINDPVYFAPQLKRFTLDLDIGARGQKKLEWWATGSRKKFDDIFSHLDTMHQRDRRTDKTDRQTPGDSKDRAYA